MKLSRANVLCLLGVFGGLLLSGLYSSAPAQEEKPDEAVVAAFVDLVKDKGQNLERRLKASDKLAELKVKDKEAVKAVANLLAEVWPDKGMMEDKETKRICWIIARTAWDKSRVEASVRDRDDLLRQATELTRRVERLGQNLAAMGGAKSAEPIMRKALALQYAKVVVARSSPDEPEDFNSKTDYLTPLRSYALKYLVQLRNPPSIAAISNDIHLDEMGPPAIEVLGQLKVKDAVPKLANVLLKSKVKEHRQAAAVALGAIGSVKGLTALKTAEAVEQDPDCLKAIGDAIKLLEAGGK
jgi:hypothetical protein